MTLTRLIWMVLLGAALQARAVYAPIPETELGKDWTFETLASVSHDSNIFAAATGEISSNVFSIAPKISYSASLTDQAFGSASYKLTLDHFDDRPGTKNLVSHELSARFAYAFTKSTTIDLSDTYSIQKNPQSLLPGVATPVSSEQSFDRNEFNVTFSTPMGAKVSANLKARSVQYNYDAAKLGADLDRTENLLGVSADYAFKPEIKVVGEYRHQIIDYRSSGGTKDKTSDFLLGGADYNASQKVTMTGRIGGERRERDGERSATAPYVEGTLRNNYAEKSYLSLGYVYTFEEASNVALYTDTQVNRFFANIQHFISGPFSVSGSISYEPSQLKGRRGVADVDETTFRFGLAGSYSPTKNWTFSVSFDQDNVSSDDASREYDRSRFGATGRLTF